MVTPDTDWFLDPPDLPPPPNTVKMQILEWPFIVVSLRHTCAIIVKSCGLMVESRTHNRKVASSSFGLAGIVGGGSECTVLSPPSIP